MMKLFALGAMVLCHVSTTSAGDGVNDAPGPNFKEAFAKLASTIEQLKPETVCPVVCSTTCKIKDAVCVDIPNFNDCEADNKACTKACTELCTCVNNCGTSCGPDDCDDKDGLEKLTCTATRLVCMVPCQTKCPVQQAVAGAKVALGLLGGQIDAVSKQVATFVKTHSGKGE